MAPVRAQLAQVGAGCGAGPIGPRGVCVLRALGLAVPKQCFRRFGIQEVWCPWSSRFMRWNNRPTPKPTARPTPWVTWP
jgi:hypothetical protein